MKVLDFDIEMQQCSEWCWAAVVAAVCRCYRDDAPSRQCEVANIVLQLPANLCTDCECQQNPFAVCNQSKNLASVLDAVHHDRGNPAEGISTLAFGDIQSDIDNGRPIVVEISLDDPAASGHAIAIYGYSDDGMVSIADPMHPDDRISVPFADFVSGAQTELHGTWKGAYLTKGTEE